MEMRHALADVGVVTTEAAVRPKGELNRPCQQLRGAKERTDQVSRQVLDRLVVRLRNQQRVPWLQRRNVEEANRQLIIVEDVRRQVTANDAAEGAIRRCRAHRLQSFDDQAVPMEEISSSGRGDPVW
jgi:hypothetical protein